MSLITVTRESTLLEEITKEWEFTYKGETYTIREYEGMDGHQVWFNGEEVEDFEEIILDEMDTYGVLELVKEY